MSCQASTARSSLRLAVGRQCELVSSSSVGPFVECSLSQVDPKSELAVRVQVAGRGKLAIGWAAQATTRGQQTRRPQAARRQGRVAVVPARSPSDLPSSA
jgi:hypothetical protein